MGVEDIYRRLRRAATDAQRLRMGKILVAVFGGLGVVMAEILAHSRGGALSTWFSVSAILSAGLAGLFLLAFLTKRANARGVWAGIVACLVFTAWSTLTALEPEPSFSSLAVGKAGIRSLAFSLHKELGPFHIHVATVTICGYVHEGTRFSPGSIAEVFSLLHRQPEEKWDREFVYQ